MFYISRLKDEIARCTHYPVVCKITCTDSSSSYIGKTDRSSHERTEEQHYYKKAVRTEMLFTNVFHRVPAKILYLINIINSF